ncbi:SDR family oxidoreductase [Candidatus Microgenomates bacterium]|nr:SDR family oxidoreductase [Candidatus Microgenomates bacterium]
MPSIKRLKIALVTGACRGIGAAICQRLLTEGYFIYGIHRGKHKDLPVFEKEIKKGVWKNIKLIKCDVGKSTDLQKLRTKVQRIKFDVLVNDAGIIEFENLRKFDFSLWEKTLSINLNSALFLSTRLKFNNRAAIVNITSTDGFIGSFSSMSYSASKAALMNLTKSLACNFGPRQIRVNSIAPGWINTGMATPSSYQATKLTPLGRNGKPEEIASVVSFLISQQASFITGSTVVVDGGYTCVDYIMKKEADSVSKRYTLNPKR